ncbi:MAG: Gfo/Idh/MocA family oxidoreductase [Gemmataceae bacterium]|nr:Gfo/Idh/MocA family oxidoreductase [Gemmataceae bacterium]
MLKLAMLGMWHTHADGIVRQVAAHPREFALVGFHDPDKEVVASRRKQWKLEDAKVFASAEKLLKEPLDGVVVEGRVHDNLKLARLALEAGKPVMLEKPAGVDLGEFRSLLELAQRKHLHVQMIYLFRYMSAVQELLTRVRKGQLGRIYEFRARLPKPLDDYARFVEELKPYKGGMFFEMAGHMVDLMVTLLGKPKTVTPFLGHHHAEGPAAYIDNAVAVCGFANAWGILEVPALEVAPHSRRFEVYGTEGACIIPHLGSGHLANKNVQPIDVFQAGAKDWERIELPAATLQIGDLREFAACIAGKKRPDFSMEHDLTVQETLLRASGMVGKT